MNDPITQVLAPLINNLTPTRRKIILRKVMTHLRGTNQQRIKAQENPDTTPYAPRKLNAAFKGLRQKRGPMFSKLRLNKHMAIRVSPNEAVLGFSGRTGMIARQHQDGITDTTDGKSVPTTKRQLLGITAEDEQAILSIVFDHLEQP